MPHIETDIVIIGGGLTGLTLAHQLKKQNKKFVLLEKNERIGGVIKSVKTNDFIFEQGPSTGILNNEYVLDLFNDLKDHCQLQRAGKEVSKRYILKNGKWQAMPMGPVSAITTPLFSWYDKFRILGEPFRKPGTDPNETLDQLVIRRMGKTFLDYAIDPFIAGVYSGNPSYLVTRFALPKLYNLEQKYGSFIGGHVKLAKEKKKNNIQVDKQAHKGGSKTFSAKGGLSNMINAIANSAGNENIVTNAQHIKITPNNEAFDIIYNLNGTETSIRSKKVITTVGAFALPELLPFIPKETMQTISNLIYAKMVLATVGFKKWNYNKVEGFGGLVPTKEHQNYLGILFPSAIFNDRAPENGALFSVFIGGMRNSDLYYKEDTEIQRIVKEAFSNTMGVNNFNPDLFEITRHSHAIPQYGIDCEERFKSIDAIEKNYPGLIIAGNLKGGIGMADRIKQAFEIAESLN